MRRGPVVVVAAVAAVAVALPAWAYLGVASSATGVEVVARSLGTPAASVSGITPSSVTLAVGAPPAGVVPTGYRVDRTAPTEASGVCTLSGAGTCTDTAPVSGRTNTYAVYALRGAWVSFTPAVVDAAVPAETRSYAVTPSTATPVAGTPFTVTITARSGGVTDPSYAGSKTLTWSGGETIGAHAPVYASPVTFANGVGTASVTLYQAGTQTLVVTDANTTAWTGAATVTTAHAAVQLALACPASAARRAAVTATLSRPAADAYGNAVTGQAVAVPVGATFATPAGQTVTVGAGATTQSFTVTMSNANQTTVLSATAPAGYVSTDCSIAHT